jgi:hypothetical protein
MPLPIVKPIDRATELERLRQQLLRQIVLNEHRRQAERRASAK